MGCFRGLGERLATSTDILERPNGFTDSYTMGEDRNVSKLWFAQPLTSSQTHTRLPRGLGTGTRYDGHTEIGTHGTRAKGPDMCASVARDHGHGICTRDDLQTPQNKRMRPKMRPKMHPRPAPPRHEVAPRHGTAAGSALRAVGAGAGLKVAADVLEEVLVTCGGGGRVSEEV